MKKRNTTIFAFLLLAAVGMGVGYAALTQDFQVTGNMTLNNEVADQQFKESVVFDKENYTINATNTKAKKADSISFDSNWSAIFSVNSLESKDDSTTATLTVINTGDVDAFIENYTLSSTHDSKVYEVTTNIDQKLGQSNIIAATNGQIQFTVTVKLLVDPTETDTDSFSLKFTAKSVPTV